ncbi:MAG: carbohydrate-binding family 9-like protein [Terriglobia bacterium]
MLRVSTIIGGLLLATLAFTQTAAEKVTEIEGLPPVPHYKVHKTKEKIVIDGRLSEEPWSKAEPITLMFPWDEQKGEKQKTTVRLLYDATNLYVGYEVEDTDVTAAFKNRDDPTFMEDCVEIFIKPSKTSNDYFGLEMNARGTLFDYFYPFPKELHKSYDLEGVQVKTMIHGTLNNSHDQDQGWTLELAIPFKNFAPYSKHTPPKRRDTWQVQINRWDGTEESKVRRLSMWCHSGLKNPHPHNPERFGIIQF